MFYVLLLAIGAVALALVHLGFVSMDDRPPAVDRAEPVEVEAGKNKIDLRGTVRIVRGVPGLLALIGFSCFNNFRAGAYVWWSI